MISWIIFSKDRAIQLDALLRTFIKFVKVDSRVYVIYKSTSSDHELAYAEVFARHKDLDLVIEHESSFDQSIKKVVCHKKHDKLAFLVDDIIFCDFINDSNLPAFDTNKVIFSLRLGSRIHKCLNDEDDRSFQPYLKVLKTDIGSYLIWRWREAQGPAWPRNVSMWGPPLSDWGVPMSLDGNIFNGDLISQLVCDFPISGPQYLENVLNINAPMIPLGMSFENPRLFNLAINRTSTEPYWQPSGSIDTNYLLEAWLKKKQISLDNLICLKPNSPHFINSVYFEDRLD